MSIETDSPFVGLTVHRSRLGENGVCSPFEGLIGKDELSTPLLEETPVPQINMKGEVGDFIAERGKVLFGPDTEASGRVLVN